MSFNEKNIFAFDGFGAILSTVFTGLIVPLFSKWTGLPVSILHFLALLPFIFAIYSMTCYWFVKLIKPWMLLGVVAANLSYCLISVVLMLLLESITFWGQVLLSAEVLVILAVVGIELSVYRKVFRSSASIG